jgi:hypothetical protein
MKPLPKGEYIGLAESLIRCNNRKLQATKTVADLKRQCAASMHKNNVLDFDFVQENQAYNALLTRKWEKRVNVRRLYTLLQNGDIKLDDFLDVIEAPLDRVREMLGNSYANDVTENFQKPIDLVITKKVEPIR